MTMNSTIEQTYRGHEVSDKDRPGTLNTQDKQVSRSEPFLGGEHARLNACILETLAIVEDHLHYGWVERPFGGEMTIYQHHLFDGLATANGLCYLHLVARDCRFDAVRCFGHFPLLADVLVFIEACGRAETGWRIASWYGAVHIVRADEPGDWPSLETYDAGRRVGGLWNEARHRAGVALYHANKDFGRVLEHVATSSVMAPVCAHVATVVESCNGPDYAYLALGVRNLGPRPLAGEITQALVDGADDRGHHWFRSLGISKKFVVSASEFPKSVRLTKLEILSRISEDPGFKVVGVWTPSITKDEEKRCGSVVTHNRNDRRARARQFKRLSKNEDVKLSGGVAISEVAIVAPVTVTPLVSGTIRLDQSQVASNEGKGSAKTIKRRNARQNNKTKALLPLVEVHANGKVVAVVGPIRLEPIETGNAAPNGVTFNCGSNSTEHTGQSKEDPLPDGEPSQPATIVDREGKMQGKQRV